MKVSGKVTFLAFDTDSFGLQSGPQLGMVVAHPMSRMRGHLMGRPARAVRRTECQRGRKLKHFNVQRMNLLIKPWDTKHCNQWNA